MSTVGLDTNILIAWIVEGRGRMLPKADAYRISHVAMTELVWALSRRFGYPKADVIAAVKRLAGTRNVVIDRMDVVRAALEDFERGGADFNDHLIARDNLAAGCITTFTLDAPASSKPGFTLLRN